MWNNNQCLGKNGENGLNSDVENKTALKEGKGKRKKKCIFYIVCKCGCDFYFYYFIFFRGDLPGREIHIQIIYLALTQ